MSQNLNPIQGMRDLLPEEVALRQYLTETILGVYQSYGFTQIETPCLEHISLLTGGEGGENEKMLFKVLKRGEKLIINENTLEKDLSDSGLRFDLTVPLSRYYATNREKLPKPFKAIQIGNVWRAERPQKGRFRQFVQCDIDIIGMKGVAMETELIMATSEALLQLSFQDFEVKINDRRLLEAIAAYSGFPSEEVGKAFIILDKADKIGIHKVREELAASGFEATAIQRFMEIIEKGGILTPDTLTEVLPEIQPEIINDLKEVIQAVTHFAQGRFAVRLDVTLVRGMGYYTGQIFEIGLEGFQSSIAGGGRYDKMIGKMLGSKEDVPACGFSIGFERIFMILIEKKYLPAISKDKIVFLYPETANLTSLMQQANMLRTRGKIVLTEPQKKNMRKQLDERKNQGYLFFSLYSESGTPEIRANQ